MLGVIKGGAVLILLSVFFAYVLAPVVAAVQRRVRVGRRQRPLSRAGALLLIYAVLLVPVGLLSRLSGDRVANWVNVTAPASVNQLFGGGNVEPLTRFIARAPVAPTTRRAATQSVEAIASYIEIETRRTLQELISAAHYAAWLAVAPVLAFLLLTTAPGFQRSALHALPHGHLQWRGEEYLRDVNSALAGYVRAQSAAALIVGTVCVAGFMLLRIPSAISMGVVAGVLELVPALGPLAAMLMAATQAGDHAFAVVVFLAALRIVQDYVIYPRLIRQGMHLSTPAVIVTMWAGAVLAGAAGVILAIPVAGFLSVNLRHWREYRDIERLVRSAERRKEADRA